MKTVIYYTQHAPTDGQIEWFLQRGYDQVLHPEELVKTPFANVGDAIARLKTYLSENTVGLEIELAAIVAVLPSNMINPFIAAFNVPVLSASMKKVTQPDGYEWQGTFNRTYGVTVSSSPFDPVLGLGLEDAAPPSNDTKKLIEEAVTAARQDLWFDIFALLPVDFAQMLFGRAFGDDPDYQVALKDALGGEDA